MSDTKNKAVRALGLCSGGLDSMLAALVLGQQGIDVAWISFETPFFSADKARAASRHTGIPLTVQRITDVYVPMLRQPACGYGKNMNPCMDCHALMFRLAGSLMKRKGIDFLFSGEVLGQRALQFALVHGDSVIGPRPFQERIFPAFENIADSLFSNSH